MMLKSLAIDAFSSMVKPWNILWTTRNLLGIHRFVLARLLLTFIVGTSKWNHTPTTVVIIFYPTNYRTKPTVLMALFMARTFLLLHALISPLGPTISAGSFVALDLAAHIQSTTNGYHALHAIINQSHPLCVDKPAIMAPDIPYQVKGQSLVEFYKHYTDNIFVNAIFLGSTQDLRSKHATDSFIGR
jgi:hypothetical protein